MSERLRERLNGAQIDRQFDSISQGGRIRTTPKPSPRSSRSLGSYVQKARSITPTESPMSSSPPSPKAQPVQRDQESEDTSATPTPQSPFGTSPEATTKPRENRRTTSTRPPPILKKSGSGPKRRLKSPSGLSPAYQGPYSPTGAGNEGAATFDDDPTSSESSVPIAGRSPRKSTTTRFNEEVAVSIPKASTFSRSSGGRISGESSQRSGRRNPTVVASTGASKRRPPVMRQRSSQASSYGASKYSPSRNSSLPNLALSMKPSDTETVNSPSQEAEAPSTRQLRGASPYPSKHPRRTSPSPSPSEGIAEDIGGEDVGAHEGSTKPSPGPSPVEEIPEANSKICKHLVDSDFRSQSMDKTRSSNPSFTNISSTNKSSAALPTAASFQAAGMLDTGQNISTAGKNKGKEAFKNEIVPLKAPASAGPQPPAETSQPLPRTKSQLTLLLEREKNRNRPTGQEP